MSQSDKDERQSLRRGAVVLLFLLILFLGWFFVIRNDKSGEIAQNGNNPSLQDEDKIKIPATSEDEEDDESSDDEFSDDSLDRNNQSNTQSPSQSTNNKNNQGGSNNQSGQNTPSDTPSEDPENPEEPEEPEDPYIYEDDSPEEEGVLYMHKITWEDVEAMEYGEIYSVVDKRNGETYRVARANQNIGDELIMLDNLTLGSSEKPMLLTPEYTDVRSDFVLPASTALPEYLTEEDEPTVSMHIPTEEEISEYGLDGGYVYSPTATIADSLSSENVENLAKFYGIYNAEQSICPRGWHLAASVPDFLSVFEEPVDENFANEAWASNYANTILGNELNGVPIASSSITFEDGEPGMVGEYDGELLIPTTVPAILSVRCIYRNPISSHYHVNYDGNGGKISIVWPNDDIEVSDTFTDEYYQVLTQDDEDAEFDVWIFDREMMIAPEGKVFAGWATDKDATEPEYYGNENIWFTRQFNDDNGELNLYAVWKDGTPTEITLNANGKEFSDGESEKTVVLSAEYTYKETNINNIKAGKYEKVEDADVYREIVKLGSGSAFGHVTYNTTDDNYVCVYDYELEDDVYDPYCDYAVDYPLIGEGEMTYWFGSNYVEFIYWSFTEDPSVEFTVETITDREAIEGDKYEIPCSNNYCEEEYFLGWSTDPGATIPEYSYYDDEVFDFITEDTTLYAVWADNIPNRYQIIYYPNGGTGEPGNDSGEYYGDSTEAAINNSKIPTRTGYKFLGYADEDDAETPDYVYDSENGTFTPSIITVSDTKSLYAVWYEMSSYYLTYSKNNCNSAANLPNSFWGYYEGEPEIVSIDTSVIPTCQFYKFVGWDVNPDAEIPTYAYDSETSTFSTTSILGEGRTKLYAIWRTNLSMQKVFEWKDQITAGLQIRVYDERDDKMYWATKLKDGKIVMTQNLDFDITTNNVTEELSDIVGEWTTESAWAPIETITGDEAMKFGNNEDDTIDHYVTTSYDVGDYYWTNEDLAEMVPAEDIEGEKDEHYSAGNFYAWGAAVAGSGKDIEAGEDAPYSICPRGWQLPSVNRTTFVDEAISYNLSSRADFRNAPLYFMPNPEYLRDDGTLDYGNRNNIYWDSAVYKKNESAIIDVIGIFGKNTNGMLLTEGKSVRCIAREKDYNIIRFDAEGGENTPSAMLVDEGDSATIETPTRDGYEFVGWSKTEGSHEPDYGTEFIPTEDMTLYAVWDNIPTLYMQDVAEWKESLEKGVQTRVIDKRDNKVYYVVKLENDDIWMTQNLDFDITEDNVTPELSDVTEAPKYLWATETEVFQDRTGINQRSFDGGNYYWNGVLTGGIIDAAISYSQASFMTAEAPFKQRAHYHVGNHYTYRAATAGTGIEIGEAPGSICPKGWRLPSSAEFTTLKADYQLSTIDKMAQAPFYFSRSGVVNSTSFDTPAIRNAGGGGYYVSSTSVASVSSKSLISYKTIMENVYIIETPYAEAYSVRCLAR